MWASRNVAQRALDGALASIDRMLEAEAKSRAMILYAENWVYAPAVRKERELLQKTGAQILWMHGEESHSGSHSPLYGQWKFSFDDSLLWRLESFPTSVSTPVFGEWTNESKATYQRSPATSVRSPCRRRGLLLSEDIRNKNRCLP